MIKVAKTLKTNGKGFWTSVAKSVKITGLNLRHDEESNWGELQVFFDTNSWDIDRDGLIYTDDLFINQLRKYLNSLGFDSEDVGYSEQGMQGDDYVSLDAGPKFIESFTKVGV
jgi:hypothetical protein